MDDKQNQLGGGRWAEMVGGRCQNGQDRYGEELDSVRHPSLENNNHPANCNLTDPPPASQPSKNRRRLQRQRTLSMAKPVLEELLQKIETLERNLKASVERNNEGKLSDGASHTATESQHCRTYASKDSAATNASDSVIARNLQVGNGNFMVFCENVESRSEQQFRQIGDKNVLININTSGNKCQIMDNISNQIVPLDSEGEIWLEIKRRSLTDATKQRGTCLDQPTPTFLYNNFQQDGPNDLSREPSIQYTEHARVPEMHERLPVQHSEDSDPTYDKIIEHPGGRLSVKIPIPTENEDLSDFTTQNLNSFLNDDKIQQYLSAGGVNFELNVCKWSYEREDIYSTVDVRKPTVQDQLYSDFPPIVPPRPITTQRDEPPEGIAPPPPLSQDRRNWYHDSMDKKQAQLYLKGKQNGAFLVRKATLPNNRHKYTIECMDEGRIRRLKILHSRDGYYFEYSENRVDTIGNAGLPIVRIGHMHGQEISNMALTIRESVYYFSTWYLQKEPLRIRIGLRSGAVVAVSVVRSTMPQHCMFGDSVNTASIMESNEQKKLHEDILVVYQNQVTGDHKNNIQQYLAKYPDLKSFYGLSNSSYRWTEGRYRPVLIEISLSEIH